MMHCRETDVKRALTDLAHERHVVIDEDFQILMAHPFSSVPLGFSVMGERTLWWGGCAWDSFALPHVIDSFQDFVVATTCPNCATALSWNVNRQNPPEGNELAHFLVPTTHMWDDVINTCGNQRIFCSQSCIEGWLTSTNNHLGYVLSLDTLWDLASGWYEGRLSRGYVRREPSAAKAYFASVGLTGPFWGLD